MHLNSQLLMDPCVCISTRKAANALTNIYDGALAKVGIKVTQYALLKTINSSSEISINALSKKTKLNRTTLTRNLAILEEKQFIEIIKDDDDLRRSVVKLTGNGGKTLKKAKALWEAIQERAKTVLGNDLAFYIELNKKLSELS